jgi:thioredoxin reductase (NADPH)
MRAEGGLDFGVEVEEGVEAEFELGFYLLAGALENVHGDAGFIAVLQLYGGVANGGDLVGGEQTHSVYQGKICHTFILNPGLNPFAGWRIYTKEVHMPENSTRDTVILGSGCAGLTAAIYTARANLKPLVLEGHEPGGQLSITTLVENFPGWPEGVQGPVLIENMKQQAVRFGAELRMAHLDGVDLSKHPIELRVGKETIHTRTLIIASGASARWLNLPSEQALIGYGVSSCATCDGFFASGKEIAVIGGGDSAMEEALFLTRFATKVTLINRTNNFRASKIMLDRAIAHPQIQFMPNTTVEEVLGVEEKDVKGLRVLNRVTGVESVLPVSFMFLGIGHVPNAKAFEGMMDLDGDGYILTRNNVFTTKDGIVLPGVFACGDIQDRRYRQAITAAGSGCMAALEVEKYLEEHGH